MMSLPPSTFVTHWVKKTFRKMNCTEYYAKVEDVLYKFRAKPKSVCLKITKEESKALQEKRKDDSHMALIADKVVTLVIMGKHT